MAKTNREKASVEQLLGRLNDIQGLCEEAMSLMDQVDQCLNDTPAARGPYGVATAVRRRIQNVHDICSRELPG